MTFTLEALKGDTNKKGGEFTPLPEGEHKAVLLGYSEKPNKKGTGIVGKLDFSLTDLKTSTGEKRRVADFLNVVHDNPKAAEIAAGKLFKYLVSVGATDEAALNVVNAEDRVKAIEEDYCFKPVIVRLKKDEKGEKKYVNIKEYIAV